jgi:hypothetical protein
VSDLLAVVLEVLNSDNAVDAHHRFRLPVSGITKEITRNPVVFPLPVTRIDNDLSLNNRPVAWALDFGMMSENIILTGTLRDNISEMNVGEITNENPPVCNLSELSEIVRTHWANLTPSLSDMVDNIFIRSKGGARLVVDEGQGQAPTPQCYQGVITTFRATRQGGNLYWDYTFGLTVTVWPIGMRKL